MKTQNICHVSSCSVVNNTAVSKKTVSSSHSQAVLQDTPHPARHIMCKITSRISIQNGVHSHKMAFIPTKWRSLPQNGVHSYKMAFIPTKWSSFPQNGVHSHKMAFIPTKWLSLPQNGVHSHKMAFTPTKWHSFQENIRQC